MLRTISHGPGARAVRGRRRSSRLLPGARRSDEEADRVPRTPPAVPGV